MTVLYLTSPAGKLKITCALVAGILAGMSHYAYHDSLWNSGRGYADCMERQLQDKLADPELRKHPVRLCPHPFLEQVLVGVSIISVIITGVSLIIYCRSENEMAKRGLKSLDVRFHRVCTIFLVIGGIFYLTSAGLLSTQCKRDVNGYDDEDGDEDGDLTDKRKSLLISYCNYQWKNPEKYLAGIMAFPVAILYFLTAKKISDSSSSQPSPNE